MQTEKPFWLDEAYSSAISDLDTGLVSRNLLTSMLLSTLLHIFFPGNGKYVDVGGGYGLLTRLMRDNGFDFHWEDQYCKNVFANGFEATAELVSVNAICAFEVLEHIHDPKKFIKNYFDLYRTRTLFFSTLIFQDKPPPVDWWYYSFATGQHISFYQKKTLDYLAYKLGYIVHSI